VQIIWKGLVLKVVICDTIIIIAQIKLCHTMVRD
jgi:hypothetical protein